MTTSAAPSVALNEPVLRWSARAHSIAEIEQELARIWAKQDLTTEIEGETARHIAARTSVMNLVVIARRPELAERGAATIQALTGRHPSRTIVVQSADPDGPSWLDARVEAHCVLPREDAAETCAETIHLTAGGEAGRHLSAIVTPLIVHDLPVTVWWPGEPPFTSRAAFDLLSGADRLVVDGSSWNGDGLERMREMAGLLDVTRLAISDFALIRQSRWREAIASIFDDPDFLPYLRSLRRIAVTYATHDETGAPGSTNVVKPIYHVAWLASRLGLSVVKPLAAVAEKATASRSKPAPGARPVVSRGMGAALSDGRGEVSVVVRPVVSAMPAGTTLRVELLAERRGSELRADVTAEAEAVHVRVWQDGVEVLERRFLAARRGEVDLLAEAIEAGRREDIATWSLRAAAQLAGGPIPPGRRQAQHVTEPEILVVADAATASAQAADRIASALRDAVDARGRADWATTGGSTPIGIYRHLATPADDEVPWPAVHVWWGDDRYVPRDHALSNVKPLDDILIDLPGRQAGQDVGGARIAVPLPTANLHPFRTSVAIGAARGAAACAAELERELRAADLEIVDGWPVLDLVLLGVGGDGHVLSVFPGSEAFESKDWALAIPAPTHIEPHVERVTLNPAILAVAREILVVMHGADKAAILGDIFGPEVDPRRWPAQLARRAGATWILDEAAAADLPQP